MAPAHSLVLGRGEPPSALVVYTVNIYGFTSVVPWFEAARDWITVATHVAFGMVAATAYRVQGNRGTSSAVLRTACAKHGPLTSCAAYMSS